MSSQVYNFGHAVTTDGSNVSPPVIDPSVIERTAVVPVAFANEKVKEVADDLRSLRDNYEKHVNQLTAYHAKCTNAARDHYEKVFHDVKTRAIRHVEIEKNARKASENELNREIETKNTTIEALRDTLAANNLLYQQASRKLKENHNEAMRILDADFSMKYESARAVYDIVEQVIVSDLQHTIQSVSMESKAQLEAANIQYDAVVEANAMSISARAECLDTIFDVLLKVESNAQAETDKKFDITVEANAMATLARAECLDTIFDVLLKVESNAQAETDAFHRLKLTNMENSGTSRDVCMHVLRGICSCIEETSLASLNTSISAFKHNFHVLLLEKYVQLSEKNSIIDEYNVRNVCSAVLTQVCDSIEVNVCESLTERLVEMHRSVEVSSLNCASTLEDMTNLNKDQVAEITSKFETSMAKMTADYEARTLSLVSELQGKCDILEVSAVVEGLITGVLNSEVVNHGQTSVVPVSTGGAGSGVQNEEWIRMKAELECQVEELKNKLKNSTTSSLQGSTQVDTKATTNVPAVASESVSENFLLVAHSWMLVQSKIHSEDISFLSLLENASSENPSAYGNMSGSQYERMTKSVNDAVAVAQEHETTLDAKALRLHDDLHSLTDVYEEKSTEKNTNKAALKKWMKDFEQENGRSANNEERSGVKHLFVAHKESTAAAKAVQDQLEIMMAEKDKLELDMQSASNATSNCKRIADKYNWYLESLEGEPMAKSETTTTVGVVGDIQQPSPDTADLVVAAAESNPPVGSSNSGSGTDSSVGGEVSSAAFAEVQKLLEERESVIKDLKVKLLENSSSIGDRADISQESLDELNSKYKSRELLIKELETKVSELEVKVNAPKKDASEEALDELESQVYQLQVDLSNEQQQHQDVVAELESSKASMDALVKEKRTDVVARYETDIAKLTATITEMNEAVIELKAEKAKSATKVKELNERALAAEKELLDHDERAMKTLPAGDEKVVLTKKVVQQREQIVLKSKAATAGWDAAADADERLEKAVEKAFEEGRIEGNAQNAGDMKSLNAAIETKETRITELVLQLNEGKKRVEELQAEVEDAKAQTSQGGLMSMFNAETGEMGVSNEELNSMREDLDTAQEEIVELTDTVDRLENQLKMAEDKIDVYDELISELRRSGGAVPASVDGMQASVSAVSVSRDGGDVDAKMLDCQRIIKTAISDGTALWKAGKKEECGDLYRKACQTVSGKIKASALRSPLMQAMETSKSLAKAKSAVALRKGLDKFLDDCKKAGMKAAEAEASKGDKVTPSASKAELPILSSVMDDANASGMSEAAVELQKKLDAMHLVSESAATAAAGKNNAAESAAASLLKRAKAAEAQVEEYKKQLSTLMASISDGSATIGSGGGGAQKPGKAGASPVKPGRRGAASAGGGVGANPVEFKKLQKKVTELEAQIKQAQDGGADKKALAAIEKKHNKAIKEQETDFNKKLKTIENAKAKAEKAEEKASSALGVATSERDEFRKKVKEMQTLLNEMNELKAKAEQLTLLKEEMKVMGAEISKLGDQYKKEAALRKKYKNELEDIKGAVRVYARCRPFAKYEIEKGCQSVVDFPDESTIKMQTSRGEKQFEFDAAFQPTSTQDEIFEDTKRLVESCLDGYNVCVFAYGQTGSGKTHTMTGNPSMPGLTPKAIDELFHLISEKANCVCKVSTYFIELYNDNLVDLYWILDNKRSKEAPPKLDIKLDSKKQVFIRNCVIKPAESPDDLMHLFTTGNSERHVGATMMNAESSRSHSVFAILVECYDKTTKKTTIGKLSMVDLAGSERADKTGAAAERLKEAQNINKSLSALGDVISALSEGEKFIPYRNNKLTQVMQDSLGGNAKTLMFVNFSPADYNCDETVTSLNYAARVKKIVNNAAKQAETEEVARLKATVKKLMSGQQVAQSELLEIVGGGGAGGNTEEDDAA